MAAAPAEVVQAAITGSVLHAKYAQEIDRESAYERLSAKVHGTAEPTGPRTALPSHREAAQSEPVNRERTREPKPEPSIVEQIGESGCSRPSCARPAARSAAGCSVRPAAVGK